MADPVLLPGTRFRLNRSAGGTPETFTLVCIATTRSLHQGKEFEDATVTDCAAPLSTPWRKSLVRSRNWSIPFSGVCDATKFADIQADYDSDDPVRYQIILDKAAADGGVTYTGPAHMESVELTSQENGIVRFTAQLRGDGKLTKAATT